MKGKNIEKKIASYSALAAGLLSLPDPSAAQVLYTDLHEDLTFGDTSGYIIDFNYDYFHDLLVFQAMATNAYFVSVQRAQDTEILGKSTGNYLYPFALNAGYLLDTLNQNWRIRDYGTLNWQGTGGNYGYWQGVTDKYLGIKIKIDGKPYLGWVRLDVAANGRSFTVKDYAIEFTTGKSIRTGEVANTSGVTQIKAIDLGNGSGMKITFNKAADESKISEYRVLLKNVKDSTLLSPNMALNFSPPNIIVVPKTGANHELVVTSSNVDIQGNPLKIGQYYQIYVLSMPDGIHTTEPVLSTNKRYFTMDVLSSQAGTPQAMDIGNNGNGQDLKISFSKAAEENKVAFYRVIVCKSEKAQLITPNDVVKLQQDRYTDVAKTGSDLEIILSPAARDTDGDLITNNIKYRVIVMSVADGTYATRHVLSLPSDEFMLTHSSGLPDAFISGNFSYSFASDVLHLHFSPSSDLTSLWIYDLHGKLIYQTHQISSNHLNIPFKNYPKGIYLMKMSNGKESEIIRLCY